jgi:hypothetical protein
MLPVPRAKRFLILTSVAAGLLLAEACTSYRAVRPGAAPRRSTPVRVFFASPRELRAVSVAGDTVMLRNVLELTGVIEKASGDTLDVRLLTMNRRPTPAADARVRVVPAPGDRFETRQSDALMTLTVTAVVLALVAGLALGIAFSGFDGN